MLPDFCELCQLASVHPPWENTFSCLCHVPVLGPPLLCCNKATKASSQQCTFSLQVEKDEDFIKSVAALGSLAEEVVKTNNAIDIYEEYFKYG